MKKLGKLELAVLKRNAANVKPFVKRLEKLQAIVKDATEEIELQKAQIDRYEEINKDMTGGLTSEEYLEALNHPELFEEDSESQPSVEENKEQPEPMEQKEEDAPVDSFSSDSYNPTV